MRVWILVGVVACGGGHEPQPDAGPIDHYDFRGECAYPLAADGALEFPSIAAGVQHATRPLVVVNAGERPIVFEYMQWEVEGTDAADFSVQPGTLDPSDAESCKLHMMIPVMDPVGSACRIDFDFHPTTTGDKHATLHVTQSVGPSTIDQTFEVRGTAVVAPQAMIASVPDFYVTPHTFSNATTLITNASTTSVAMGQLVTQGPFPAATWNCPDVLTPGGACNVTLPFTVGPTAGCPRGALTTSTSAFTVPLTGRFQQTTVTVAASAHGSVRIDPPGKLCTPGGSDCTVTLDAPADLTLTAIPETGGHFTGWSGDGACGTAASCVVHAGAANVSLTASFASAQAKAIAITIAGTGSVSGAGTCTSSCTQYAEPNTGVTLTASTTGAFVGWSGDCSGTGVCNLGTVVNDRAVTATFSP